MTALDRAFIKAYGRPRRSGAAPAPARPPAPTSVEFERGPAQHRIDPAESTSPATAAEPPAPTVEATAPTLTAPTLAAASSAALPSIEQIHRHALETVGSASPEAEALEAVRNSVAATAADLSRAWPARFSADSRSLFDAQPVVGQSETPAPAAAVPAASTARPLSTFAPAVPAADPVSPLLEVDRFEWPAECNALCATSPGALDPFVSRLMSGAAEGMSRVALVGVAAAAGPTTAAMCLARRAGGQGANWVLVDADFARPRLAGRLGILGQAGWPRVLAGERELGEVMIASLEDRFAIVPCEPAAALEPWSSPRTAEVFDLLADAYDLVLVDAGTVGPGSVEHLSAFGRMAHLAAVYLVYDARTTSAVEVSACARRLSEAGLRVAGAIENFAPRGEDPSPR